MAPIPLPTEVSCVFSKDSVDVTGPKGSIRVAWPNTLSGGVVNNALYILPKIDGVSAQWGTMRSRLNSLVRGVSTGWTRKFYIKGVGYNAQKTPGGLIFSLGKSHQEFVAFEGHETQFPDCIPSNLCKKNAPVYMIDSFPKSISVDLNKEGTEITLGGIDTEVIGNVGHKLKKLRPRNPYKGDGIWSGHDILRSKKGKQKK